MAEELKIFIGKLPDAENQVIEKGAKFTKEIYLEDIYFNQPEGEVLKLTKSQSENSLTKLKAQNGGFAFVSKDVVENPDEKIKELSDKFGIKCFLKKKIRYFAFESFQIDLLEIENLGNFLIVEGDKVPKEVVEEKLGFSNPKYLTISFDKLKEQQQKN